MYELSTDNNLIFLNQSSFKPGDSCNKQLLFITNGIYTSFDDGLEVRGISFRISKALNKAWHKGFFYKLKQDVISGKLFDIITDFLSFRKQRAVSNGQYLKDQYLDHCCFDLY